MLQAGFKAVLKCIDRIGQKLPLRGRERPS